MTGISINNLATLERDRGNNERALELLRDAKAICIDAYGPDHPDVAGRQINIGLVQQSLERYPEAEQALLDCWRIREGAYGGDHYLSIAAAGALVDLYEAWGRPDAAGEWRARLPDARTESDSTESAAESPDSSDDERD